MTSSQEQRQLWLSTTLAQADLSLRLPVAAAWMRSERAAIGDLSHRDTLTDFAAAVGLTGTEQRRLKLVIGSVFTSTDVPPLPEIKTEFRDEPLEEEVGEGRDWVRALPDDLEPSRVSEPHHEGASAGSSGPAVPSFLPPPGLAPGQTSADQRQCKHHKKWRDLRRMFVLPNGEHECTPGSRCGISKSDGKGSARPPKIGFE